MSNPSHDLGKIIKDNQMKSTLLTKHTILFVIGVVFMSFFFNSCQPESVEEAKQLSLEEDFKTITKQYNTETYKISIPKYMEPTEILNPDAQFQFLHLYKEEYIIVINESKQEFKKVVSKFNEFKNEKTILNQYSQFQTQFLKQKMNILHQSNFEESKINTLNTQHLELLVKLGKIDENITYFINYIEGEENLYFVMAWTLESKKEVFNEKYKKIIASFIVE